MPYPTSENASPHVCGSRREMTRRRPDSGPGFRKWQSSTALRSIKNHPCTLTFVSRAKKGKALPTRAHGGVRRQRGVPRQKRPTRPHASAVYQFSVARPRRKKKIFFFFPSPTRWSTSSPEVGGRALKVFSPRGECLSVGWQGPTGARGPPGVVVPRETAREGVL